MNQETKPNKDYRKVANAVGNASLTATQDKRFCIVCHTKLIQNPYDKPEDKYVYKCTSCGVITTIQNTEPTEQIRTAFPSRDLTRIGSLSEMKIVQADRNRVSRSEYFIQKNIARLNSRDGAGQRDPFYNTLKNNNRIKIIDVEYNVPDSSDKY